MNAPIIYEELTEAARIINSGATRAVLLQGNVDDLFYGPTAENGKEGYIPLVDLVSRKWNTKGRIVVTYQLNGPIRIEGKEERMRLLHAWVQFRTGIDLTKEAELRDGQKRAQAETAITQFNEAIAKANGQPAVALEALRQFCLVSRGEYNGIPVLPNDSLVVIVESMDMLVPQGDPSRLSDADRHRVAICKDWITDPSFLHGNDVLIMLAESRGSLNDLVAKLPQIMAVDVPAPNEDRRRHCITWFNSHENSAVVAMPEGMDFATWTAGLSIHALMQLMRGARHAGGVISPKEVIRAVEAYIKSQLGDDVVEFKKPTHRLTSLVGNAKLKAYLTTQLIPRFKARDKTALTGAVIGGPIGVGKTYVFEAVATELDMPVLVLKQIRSQWYGQTDVIIDRLRRLLNSLSKALIFVDEADTQFGSISTETHATEKRATGQFLQMMSDPILKGKILWLLMTARVHLLPPDIMRPGRLGDLILVLVDPEGKDLEEFIDRALAPAIDESFNRTHPLEVPGAANDQQRMEAIVWERSRFERMQKALFATALIASMTPLALSIILIDPWQFWAVILSVVLFVSVCVTTAFLRHARSKNAEALIAQVKKEHPTVRPFIEVVHHVTQGYSPATFELLRSELQVARIRKTSVLTHDEILVVIRDMIPAEIEKTRRYQTLQALLHCTRRSLLPDLKGDDLDAHRTTWRREIAALEREGIR